MPDIHQLLAYVVEHKASDLHIKAGSPPSVRIGGSLSKFELPAMGAAEVTKQGAPSWMRRKLQSSREQGRLTSPIPSTA